jgi:ABC-type multidrug transport system fused ATPase/permease subunit
MGETIAALREILDRPTKLRLVGAAAGATFLGILDMVAIALVLPLVDLATSDRPGTAAVKLVSSLLGDPGRGTLLLVLTVAVVVLFVLKDLGALAYAWWMNGFVFTERVRTSARILRHYLTSPWTTVSQRSAAELMRTSDAAVMQVFNYSVNGLLAGFAAIVSTASILVALLVVATVPTLVVGAYLGVAALVQVRVVRPRAVHAGQVMAESSMAGYRTLLAALGGLKEIVLRGSERHFAEAYERAALRGALAGRQASFYATLPRYVLEILFIVAVGIILLLGRDNPNGGPIALLAVFVAAGMRIIPAISAILGAVSNIRIGSASLDLVRAEVRAARDGLDVSEVEAGAGHSPDAPALTRSLRVEGVSFRYPGGERDVLRDVDLEVPMGTSLALVGGSGAGKSTLADVMLGLHEPASGRVTVDGVDARAVRDAWRRAVGYVPQDVFLLDATLAENIAFDVDRPQIDDDLLRRAVAAAQLDDVVAGLPDGLESQLGERGSRLSGGQRQRVGIARALYRRPQVLVLDEATSALDNETEHRIAATLDALRGELTVVMIAHRLSTVRTADQVAFLKDGRVEAIGSFDAVRRASPDFDRLVRLGHIDDAQPSVEG